MPRSSLPQLRRHKGTGQGLVRLPDANASPPRARDFWLGVWPESQEQPPPTVRQKYDSVIAEWLAAGRELARMPSLAGKIQPPVADATPSRGVARSPQKEGSGSTVLEVIAAYVEHAQAYYVDPEGKPTSEMKEIVLSLRPLRFFHAEEPADAFGPLKLKRLREHLITGYEHSRYGPQPALCRKLINRRVDVIKRMFKWAASEELVPPSVYHGLQAVAGLRRGRSAARETGPVLPVEVDLVERTLPHLPPHVAGILELMLHTGMRPGEACRIRLAEIDRSGEVWLYRPSRHKTAHHGHARVIAVGPKAQSVLRRFIRVQCPHCGAAGRPEILGFVEGRCPQCAVPTVEVHPSSEAVFSPWWQREERYLEMRRARKTKVQPSQENRRKEDAQRLPGESFTPSALGHSIRVACKRHHLSLWHPNQLRHTHATLVRRAFGLEAAQVVLGHSKADITQVYAERDEALAASVALKMG